MAQRGEKLLICPECHKCGVSFREKTSEDHYGCRYCEWFCFTNSPDGMDKRLMKLLEKTNPEWQRFAV